MAILVSGAELGSRSSEVVGTAAREIRFCRGCSSLMNFCWEPMGYDREMYQYIVQFRVQSGLRASGEVTSLVGIIMDRNM
jgi:hypothetical protein